MKISTCPAEICFNTEGPGIQRASAVLRNVIRGSANRPGTPPVARSGAVQSDPDDKMPLQTNAAPTLASAEVVQLARQLSLDLDLLFHEIYWALGEERINRVTPTYDRFRDWARQSDGLSQFWEFANTTLRTILSPDEVEDIWRCIDLTLNARKRRAFTFQDYLVVATRSEQICEICEKRPPEVTLEIDHILPITKGGSNGALNLRFLCQYHNRSRGNRFRWADIWRSAV